MQSITRIWISFESDPASVVAVSVTVILSAYCVVSALEAANSREPVAELKSNQDSNPAAFSVYVISHTAGSV